MLLLLKCCFMSTQTVGLLGTAAQDGLLSFEKLCDDDDVELNVLGCRLTY